VSEQTAAIEARAEELTALIEESRRTMKAFAVRASIRIEGGQGIRVTMMCVAGDYRRFGGDLVNPSDVFDVVVLREPPETGATVAAPKPKVTVTHDGAAWDVDGREYSRVSENEAAWWASEAATNRATVDLALERAADCEAIADAIMYRDALPTRVRWSNLGDDDKAAVLAALTKSED